MTRSERRILIYTSILGVLLTLLVAVLDYTGLLAAPERLFYDMRARYCQYFNPPPTDKLVHIDIDDPSLEAIGFWPWPRSKMAQIIDEIRIAGAKTVGLDVIYAEPEPPGYQELQPLQMDKSGVLVMPSTAPAGPTTAPTATPPSIFAARRIDHDAVFAESLRRFGRALVPMSLDFSVQRIASAVYSSLVCELTGNMELDQAELVRRLQVNGHQEPDLVQQVESHYLNARRDAMLARVAAEMANGDRTLEQLRARILPNTDPQISGSPALRMLEAQYTRLMAIRSLQRFARPLTPDLPRLLDACEEQATVRQFSQAAGASGFVNYIPLSDGIVRTVPLWASYRGMAYPQMGLALACAMLDVHPKDLRITAGSIAIPRAGDRPILIPVHDQETPRGQYGAFMDIPWFGTSNWQTMYDYPAHRQTKQHMPIRYIWSACECRSRIIANNQRVDDALIFLLQEVDLAKAMHLLAHPLDPQDVDGRRLLAEQALAKIEKDGTVDFYSSLNPADLSAEDRAKRDKMVSTPAALRELVRQTSALQSDLASLRVSLRQQLEGRAALIGYVAVAAIADFVPTSLHPRCPGVMAHGAIFNAIMTNHFWRPVPRWVTIAITLAAGLLTMLVVARLSAWKAMATAAALGIGYLLLNGLYLFDYQDLLVGVTAPVTAIGFVWTGGTLTRYILEQAERARAEKLFRNYVDPALVDYVLGDENAKLDGQLKELTVVFTDLEGFTTLSEQLRERSVPLLNEYMGLMVPIIRKHRGYLNKLLGDGIMYFFAAPLENPHHAMDAVASALEMQEVMVGFNELARQRGLPTLRVRAGIGAGHMVVGNCGPADRTFSDYTVLGDTVNLGARLESANKAFGTRILVNDRARELVGDRVLFRPVGKIRVKGKQEGIMTFEALSLVNKATDQQRKFAETTNEMVKWFMEGQFERSLRATVELDEAFGSSKLTSLYRSLCEEYLHTPPADFDGQIVLTEK